MGSRKSPNPPPVDAQRPDPPPAPPAKGWPPVPEGRTIPRPMDFEPLPQVTPRPRPKVKPRPKSPHPGAEYLKKQEWSMGNGQCPSCEGLDPKSGKWAGRGPTGHLDGCGLDAALTLLDGPHVRLDELLEWLKKVDAEQSTWLARLAAEKWGER